MAQTHILLNNVAALGAGPWLKIPPLRLEKGSIPFQLIGAAFVGTVSLEATLDGDQAVEEDTARASLINGGSFTNTDVADVLFGAYPHIRANVTSYTGGNLTVLVHI